MQAVIQGLVVGLLVSVPVGPVGLFCLERTVSRGWKTGVSSTLGMNLADVISALLVLLGIGFIAEAAADYTSQLQVVSGIVIAIIGLFMIFKPQKEAKLEAKDLAISGISTFLIAISPATLALMILLFPMLGVTSFMASPGVILGVFLGSCVWSVLILLTGHYLGKRIGKKMGLFRNVMGTVFTCIGASLIAWNLLHLI